jgi:hypothetical protein
LTPTLAAPVSTLTLAAEQAGPATDPLGAGFTDLVAGLTATPGCLGVETAGTVSGKRVIFAWFENKRALVRWYSSEAHMRAIQAVFPGHQGGRFAPVTVKVPGLREVPFPSLGEARQ